MDIAKLLKEIGGEEPLAKTASAHGEPMEKLAAELDSAGRIMAESFVDRVIELLEKRAAAHPNSSHAAGTGVKEPSKWSAVKEKHQKFYGAKKGGEDEGHTRAEDVIEGVARHNIPMPKA
jgi:hypothetical protein